MEAEILDDVITVNLIRNNTKQKMSVFIEPWADEFTLLPDESIEIHVVAEAWDRLVTVYGSDHIDVWLWNGCRARIYREGVEVTANSFAVVFPY